MIIVDDIVFSTEAWNWFNINTNKAILFKQQNTAIPDFMRNYIKTDKLTYKELNAGEFWELFERIYLLMSDILKDYPILPTSVSMQELKMELLTLEKGVVFWSLEDQLLPEQLKGLNQEFVSSNRDSTNMRFCIYSYCMINSIFEKYEKLAIILHGRSPPDLPRWKMSENGKVRLRTTYPNNEFAHDEVKAFDFIKGVVRSCCGGDFDDFIISVKAMMAEETIDKYQYQLALIKGYELMGITNFEATISKQEAWRRLFTNYFDKEETNFLLFYNEYTRQCLFFMMLSYLSISNGGNISYIPVYRIYSDNDFRETYDYELKTMIDTKLIRNTQKRLYFSMES